MTGLQKVGLTRHQINLRIRQREIAFCLYVAENDPIEIQQQHWQMMHQMLQR